MVTTLRTGAKLFLHIIGCKKKKVCIYCVQMLNNKTDWKNNFIAIFVIHSRLIRYKICLVCESERGCVHYPEEHQKAVS